MKNLKRFYAVAIALTMLVSLLVPVTAASDYMTEADTLNALGLYKGISTEPGVFNPDLDSTLNRQTAATMVLRLFGLEDEALSMDEMEARDILESKFKDAASVDGWAVKQVAYAVEADIIKGFPDGTFAPKGLLTGKQYCTLLLKMLGYNDFTFDIAGARYAEVAGLSISEEMAFSTNSSIPKSILVGASYSALRAMPEGSTSTLAEELVADGIIDATVAESYGLVTTVEPTVEPSMEPSEEPSEEPSMEPTATPDPNATVDPNATATPEPSYDSNVVVSSENNTTVMAQNVNDFNFLNLKVKNNNASEVTFTQFTIEMDRYIGKNTNVSDIKLWEGTTKKSLGTTTWTGSTYSAVVNLTTPIKIAAGEEKMYKITADVATMVVAEQYKFTITNMNFGGSPVEGLPLSGNAVQVSTIVNSGTVAIANESVVTTNTNFPIGGRNVEVGKFKLTAPSDEKVMVKSLKIANNATGTQISTSEVDNVEIYNGDKLLGQGPVEQDIVFTEELEIPASGNVILTIKINTNTDADNGDKFRASIAEVTDIDASGDLFGSSLDLDTTWQSVNTYTASKAQVEVTGIQPAQSTTALQSAKDFKLGTVYVKNNNVEDIRLSTLKVNITTTVAFSADSIKNLRLVAPDGTTVLDSETNIATVGTAGTNATNATDRVVTFSLANEYTIAKNTEVGFTVLADIPTVDADATKSLTLGFYNPSTTANTSHLLAVGISSGTQLYASSPAANGSVLANEVRVVAATGQTVKITPAAEWDDALNTALAAGSGRVVTDWKIADPGTLNENAKVTELKLTADQVVGITPESFYMSNFELYHDGVKVATAATMSSTGVVTFGNGVDPIFEVTDGDEIGKSLVVKADISTDITANAILDLQLAATADITAEGSSTGQPILADATELLTNDKVIKTTYVVVADVPVTAVNVGVSNATELLKFTITPQNGKVINLSDMAITFVNNVPTTTVTALTLFDVTKGVTVSTGAAAFDAGTDTMTVTAADATYDVGGANQITEARTFALRANTTTLATNASYSVGIKYVGQNPQITAVNANNTDGFAAVGDKITGATVTVTK
jgi:hypothetical protein